ncbi:hypothetical protein SNEBB_010188 [Seison nebaliae]|nr:hypothetical protein SNEBB_010188 [Seison nebaliae]
MGRNGAIQRLLNMVRDAQNSCTDSQCFTPGENQLPVPPNNGNLTSTILIAVIWLFVAFGLFYLRPSNLRRQATDVPEKPVISSENDRDDRDPPSVN